MVFEWDEHKRHANLEKHGIDFIRASEIFDGRPIVTVPSANTSEERYLSVGRIEGHVITVVWTLRSETIRIISARRSRLDEISALDASQRRAA
jgi:uncharacterized DUF497 family protein